MGEKEQQAAKGLRTIAKRELSRLSKRMVYEDSTQTFIDRLREESDRGVILLLSTLLEDGLVAAIGEKLPGKGHIEDKQIFGYDAPIGSFSKKTLMALALGVIGPQLHALIELVRDMRNKAAHLSAGVTFEDPAIRAALFAMIDARSSGSLTLFPRKQTRDVFILLVMRLNQLVLHSISGPPQSWDPTMKAITAAVEENGKVPFILLHYISGNDEANA